MAAYTAIDDPEVYFQVKLYTGDGSTPSITLDGDTDMQPGLVWIKNRDATDSHCLFDAVRTATEVLHPDATTAETTDADTLTSFDSDGFALGADVKVNTNTEKYVAWCWKANGSGSANTDGSISSTVSANTTLGFSIVKFTTDSASGNATIGHGLGVVPKIIIRKELLTSGWDVFHESVTSGGVGRMTLHDTGALDTVNDPFGEVAPASSVFTYNQAWTGAIGYDSIAYCFAEKQGFSKFGSYIGNGNEDGPFVYTGFRPAYVMEKRANDTGIWNIQDNKRSTYNVTAANLLAESNAAEYTGTGNRIDILSNGFKCRKNDTDNNGDGDTIIYMAFAEAPFVNSNGVPCNAR